MMPEILLYGLGIIAGLKRDDGNWRDKEAKLDFCMISNALSHFSLHSFQAN